MSPLHHSGSSRFYKELAELPVPTSANFINSTPQSDFKVARISYSIRNLDGNVKRSTTNTFTWRPATRTAGSRWYPSSISHDTPEVLASLPAPSGERHALLREVIGINGDKKRFVEVWSDAQLEASLEVTKLHGPFHTDDCFKSFSFTPTETAVVYTAEANKETATKQEDDDPFPKFRYVPNFGEQLYTRKLPTLFVFRWRSPDVTLPSNGSPVFVTALTPILDQPYNIPVAFGQARFISETRLCATGFEQTADGRLLGIQYCWNRPASIWELVLPDETSETGTTMTLCQSVMIGTPGRSCRSPRVLFDENGVPDTLFWLSNPLGGAHASTVSLHARDLKGTGKSRVLIDAVDDPRSPNEFPGLYTDNLADSPFLRIGGTNFMLAQSLWRSRTALILINLRNGAVRDVMSEDSDEPILYSMNLLATDGRQLAICSRSQLTAPPSTLLLMFESGCDYPTMYDLDGPSISPELHKAISSLSVQVLPIPNRYPVETIVVNSKEPGQGRKPFCMTIIHGGPHSSSITSFNTNVLAYALEGYTISLPNYTGSVGYGEKYIQKLVGSCGTLDVADCLATVEELIRLGLSERGRQIVQGGSHGGFLTTHLIGQYPNVFSAAVVRNPVTSVGEFCTTSDIGDWAFSEFGLPYGPRSSVTPDTFATLYAASPMAYVDLVKTPLLVMLGEDDLRVPPAQGKSYYHALKGRGRVVDLLVFPKETHPIDGVEAARVSFEAGRDWFRGFVLEGK